MPTDADLIEFYQGFKFRLNKPDALQRMLPAIKASLTHFAGEPKDGDRFLDYGGGTGIYALAAQQLGWEVTLFDYDKSMVEFGRNELGLNQAVADISDVDGTFDVIFAFHVVEHWNDWDKPFMQLLERLNNGGSIILATPNARSLEKSVRQRHRMRYEQLLIENGVSVEDAHNYLAATDSITCWNPPRHLFAFTPDSFCEIGQRYGLETSIFIGYNTNPLFEPRLYVVPRPFTRIKRILADWRRPRIMALNFTREGAGICREIKEFVGIKKLEKSHPSLGEQLYVKFKKNLY